MIPESSPFTPGLPVPAESFVGRESEIVRVRGLVRAAKDGRVRTAFVSGERGIGKSSLAGFVRGLSERQDDVVGCHVYLGGVQDLAGMLQRTFDRLLKDSIGRPWHQPMLDLLGRRVRSVGLFGATLELRLSDDDVGAVERNFAHTIREFLKKTGKGKSLFLVLDDFNGLAGSARFANWLKSTVDEIATSRQTTRLCLLMVGLAERRRELIRRQPSLARVFELVDIAPRSDEEVAEFYEQAFPVRGRRSAAGRHASLGVLHGRASRPGARDRRRDLALGRESGDHPPRGGAGGRSRRPSGGRQVPGAPNSCCDSKRALPVDSGPDRSRSGLPVTRAEVLERLSGDDRKALDNFLRRMTKLGGLEAVPEIRGGYRFPNHLSKLYYIMSSRSSVRGDA